MEDRIRSLETQVGDLREQRAEDTTEIRHLRESIVTLNKTVGELRDILNKGKGAWLVIVVIAGAIGAAATTVFKKLLGIV